MIGNNCIRTYSRMMLYVSSELLLTTCNSKRYYFHLKWDAQVVVWVHSWSFLCFGAVSEMNYSYAVALLCREKFKSFNNSLGLKSRMRWSISYDIKSRPHFSYFKKCHWPHQVPLPKSHNQMVLRYHCLIYFMYRKDIFYRSCFR